MSRGATRIPVQHLRELYGSGTLIGFTDGQLLARFAELNDGPAFETLVGRHGSMVVATCRAILAHEHDVEDAFQATFLVLARKANSVRAAGTLGGWLHRVAFRIALQAKNEAMRRKRLESELAAMRISDATRAGSEIDLHSVLHEEIERLPERERLPVVLCDLEGLTYEQAAGRLRCTEQALGYRLARARTRLRDRLSRRGVTATALGAVVATVRGTPRPRPPPPIAWTQAAVAAATAGPTSAMVAALTRTMIRRMLMTQLKIASAATLAATACASFGVFASGRGTTRSPSARGERHDRGPARRILGPGRDGALRARPVREAAPGPACLTRGNRPSLRRDEATHRHGPRPGARTRRAPGRRCHTVPCGGDGRPQAAVPVGPAGDERIGRTLPVRAPREGNSAINTTPSRPRRRISGSGGC